MNYKCTKCGKTLTPQEIRISTSEGIGIKDAQTGHTNAIIPKGIHIDCGGEVIKKTA